MSDPCPSPSQKQDMQSPKYSQAELELECWRYGTVMFVVGVCVTLAIGFFTCVVLDLYPG